MLASPIGFDILMVVILIMTLFITFSHKTIPRIGNKGIILISIIAILQLGLTPAIETIGPSRPNYTYIFYHTGD